MTWLPALIRRLCRALAGLAAAAALLAGVPYLLLRLTGSPLPQHPPAWPQVRLFLTSPLSDDAIMHGLAGICWVLWALLALCLVIEAGAALTGRPAPRLPGLGPLQALAASLLGVTVLTALPAGLGASPLPAVLTAHIVAAGPLLAGQPAHSAAPATPSAAPAARSDPGRAPRVYRVVSGDDLWGIAERCLGNGERWHEIYALNVGKPQADGRALASPGLIYPGWVLLLPSPAPHQAPFTGDAGRPPSARHPHPPTGPAAMPPPSPARPHNDVRHTRPYPHPSPHHRVPPAAVRLPSGALIGIPVAMAVAAALVLVRIQRRRRYLPRHDLTVPPLAEPPLPEVITALRRAAHSASAPGDEAASSEEPPGDDPYLDLYQPEAVSPDTHEPGTAASRLQPAGHPEPRFVPAPAVAGIPDTHPRPAAVSTPALPPADAPDLDLYATSTEPPALAPARLHGQPANGSPPATSPAADPTSRPASPQPASPAAISLGIRGDSPASLDITAVGGLGLTGPGAPGAARAILATLLTQTPPGQPGLPAEVIIPAPDAARLLPGQDTTGIPGLSVPASLEDALAQMEAALLRQARTTPGMAGPSDTPPAGPGTTLIATCGTSSSARLRAITTAGSGLGIATVVLGPWPDGITCQIATDGVVTAATPADERLEGLRLFHLGGTDATAITDVLREACGTYLPAAPSAPDRPPDDPPARPHTTASPPAPAPRTRPAEGPASSPGHDAATDPDRPAASKAPAVQLTLLGPPRITVGGQEVGSGMRKARELLTLLAVHRDGITGEAINEALWPDLDPDHATRQRNLALRKARELLRTATGLPEPMWVLLTAGRYHLDPHLISADLWQFHDALHRAQHTADPGQQIASCQQAVALYRGELAEDAGYEWADPPAQAARHLALYAWTKIADLLQARDPGQALAALETAVRHDPYNEFLYQRIMRLQADAGHPDAVRRTLSLLESQLAHLGVTPGVQTRQLAAALLSAPNPARPHVGSG